jgi:uncharacterized protein
MPTRLQSFRALRTEIEQSILPLATSVDGRRFTFQASLHGLALQVGGYVMLEHESGNRLGQVLSLEFAQRDGTNLDLPPDHEGDVGVRTEVMIRYASGSGAVLGGDDTPFHDAHARPATAEEVSGWIARQRKPSAALTIGELALLPGVPATIDAGGFDRHTFLCGQSGSGKTYSLGVVLEQLLTDTGLRIVILDPNSDYVRLGEVREDADPEAAARYRAGAGRIAVHSAHAGGERLRLRFAEVDPAAQAALLRIDPIADREEYAELSSLLAEGTVAALEESHSEEARRLMMRARNLGADRFAVWARGEAGSVLDAVHDQDTRCVVVDLGSLATREEQALVAETVLGSLWERRTDRRPVLIVIDEAHNVCPGQPDDPLTAIATRHAVRIAAEGRKFGLYLLVATQRPQKVHENVVSQCDNLVLMRLNSEADAAFAHGLFSFVAPGLIARATTFTQGEALVAGKLSPHPALVRFAGRVAEEGGADVPATWAAGAPVA